MSAIRMNNKQRELYTWYRDIDPGCTLLGTHKNRPVVWTYIDTIDFQFGSRHIIVLSEAGEPVRLPENGWHEDFVVSETHTWSYVCRLIENHGKLVRT